MCNGFPAVSVNSSLLIGGHQEISTWHDHVIKYEFVYIFNYMDNWIHNNILPVFENFLRGF